jgi:hypothetical protein
MSRVIQYGLDKFHDFRKFILDCIAFVSIRIFGIECTFTDVKRGRYNHVQHQNRNLDNAKDLDALLATAKDCYKAATDRRNLVTDKCKTLLTLSSFILAVSGLFLPKSFDFDAWWMRASFFAGNCLARLPPVFPRKSAVSSSARGRFWAYEAVNPRFSPEKQALDALNNYLRSRLITAECRDAVTHLFRCRDRDNRLPRSG